MKPIFTMAADLAHLLAANKNITLDQPCIIKANEEAGIRLNATHCINGYFFIRKQSFGLVLWADELARFNRIEALHQAGAFKFKGYGGNVVTRSYSTMHQIVIPNICAVPHYKELKAEYVTSQSFNHNMWANIIGLRLFEDFIEQLLPVL